MYGRQRKRHRVTIGSELLESRQLLNAHVPHHPTVHVESVSPKPIHQISGKLTGQASYAENTVNLALGTDSYSLSGKTNHGVVSLTSQDSVNSVNITPSTFHDLYYAGSSTLTLSDGATISISYVGSGHSSSVNPHYTATFEGRAIGTSGAELGHLYSYTATVVGNGYTNGPVTIKFSLKD